MYLTETVHTILIDELKFRVSKSLPRKNRQNYKPKKWQKYGDLVGYATNWVIINKLGSKGFGL